MSCWEALLGEHPELLISRFLRKPVHPPAFPPDPWSPQVLPRNSLFAFGHESCFFPLSTREAMLPVAAWVPLLRCKLPGKQAAGHPLCLNFMQGQRPPASPGSAACSLTHVLCRARVSRQLEVAPSPQTSFPTAAGSLTSPTATWSISGSRPLFCFFCLYALY